MSKAVYFVGIGGIGMSAIARFYLTEGWHVAGYDRTASKITDSLIELGAEVSYEDRISSIPDEFKNVNNTLVVYTPAIPNDSQILTFFRTGGFEIIKRAVALGRLTENKYLMAVAGSHGKSTTSTLTAYINHIAAGEGSAFLGAVSKNFDSNLVIGKGDRMVVEADEFDRSFLHLKPNAVVITAVDPDHLDIYGTAQEFAEGFAKFVECIKPGGVLIYKKGINIALRNRQIKYYTYSLTDESADFYACNLSQDDNGLYKFDIVTPACIYKNCKLGITGKVNIENAVAAVALASTAGFDKDMLSKALESFSGIKRRFDYHIKSEKIVYMDDYAHHPGELSAMLQSVRDAFPNRKLTIAFQPHLYTRTRDFAEGFSSALSLADRVWLLPIYPARELPIEGVSSEMLMKNIKVPVEIVKYENLVKKVETTDDLELFVTAGAGDIDRLVDPIAVVLNKRV